LILKNYNDIILKELCSYLKELFLVLKE